MKTASFATIEAVLPKMKDSKPAACPRGICWITPKSEIPAPKKTLRMTPNAVSSLSFVRFRIARIAMTPSNPVIVAPRRRRGRDFSFHPQTLASKKLRVIPGKVAWLMASPIRARLRRRVKTPTTPAAHPSIAVPRSTTRVL